MLHAITLHRPWGHAIAYLGKDIENRSWSCPLPVGSFIAIHNGKAWDSNVFGFIYRVDSKFYVPTEETDPKQSIVAVAKFAGNHSSFDSPWWMGPIGWQLQDVVPIAPVSCRGNQGVWRVPDDVANQVRKNYREALKLRREST